MKSSQQLRDEIAALNAKVEAIVAVATEESRELSTEELAEVDAIQGAGDSKGKISDLQAQLERALKIEARAQAVLGNRLDNESRVPAKPRATGNVKGFEDPEEAYTSGQFLLASIGGNRRAQEWCRNHGVQYGAMGENDDMKGGVFVPPGFESAIIKLMEEYGVFGREARNYPMTTDTVTIPRRLSGLTAYAVSEAGEIQQSDATFAQISMTARKWATLTRISSELNEDSVISMASYLADEIAYAHAVKQDQCYVDGDGTTAYHGIVGLKNVLKAGSIHTATGRTTMSALTLEDLEAAVAKLPRFPGISPKFYFHSSVYWQTGARLQLAAGGVTTQMIASGPQLTLFGYPVVFSNALPSAPTTGTIYGYFGDLSMASTIGNRRGVTISADSSRYFEFDQVAIRSTLRYDINIHETGTASAAGPVIQLKLG